MKFLSDQSGAVTVDWVVLTAGVVGLGLASAAAVSTGTTSLGSDIDSSLSGASVAALRFNHNEIMTTFVNGIGAFTSVNPDGGDQITWSDELGPDGEPGVLVFTDRLSDATWVTMSDDMTGDQSDKYGGSLSFDMNIASRSGSDYTGDPSIIEIRGTNGVTLTYENPGVPPTGEWSSFSASLTEGSLTLSDGSPATEAQIRDVLADVADTRLRAEYIVGSERILYDNIRFN